MKAEKIIERLQKQITLLEALAEREIAGFALIVPPDGEAVEILSIESAPDQDTFYRVLVARLASRDPPYGGGVNVPGMGRR